MGSDYHYRVPARWEELAGVRVPVDKHGHYLSHEDVRERAGVTEARDVTSPYGSLHFAVGYGEEGDEDGDWMTCFDHAELPDGRVVLHSAVNTESGGYVGDGEYLVVPKDEAPAAALGMVDQALETVAEHGRDHDEEGWNQDPYYFARSVARACGLVPYAGMSDGELRRGKPPVFGEVTT